MRDVFGGIRRKHNEIIELDQTRITLVRSKTMSRARWNEDGEFVIPNSIQVNS